MTLPRKYLTELDAHSIKQDLYDGVMRQWEIAEKFGISQPMVSKILRGHEWHDTEWPDRSIGHMPETRYRELLNSKRRAARYNSAAPVRTPSQEAVRAAEEVEKILRNKRKDSPLFTPPIRKDDSDYFHWMDVRSKDPAHPLVEAQETDPDPDMQLAMVIVLEKIPVEEWQHPASLELIHKTHKQIKESPHKKII